MAYNYDDQIPTWQNEGTEPADSVKTEGYKAGYKPPAAYFNWFWSRTLRWLNDLRSKLSSLHTQVTTVEEKVSALEQKDYDISADDVLIKLKTVDGANSGLDADTLDGKDSSAFADADHTHSQYSLTTHTHPLASKTQNGFMSSEAFTKLDAIDLEHMTTYTHPSTHPATMITGLSTVATTGNYADLINKPTLSAVATSNDYNDLINKPAVYVHPTTHPASMIEETENIKMFLAEERAKLAAIEAQANNYVHPTTHPASMITGLSDYISSLGYGKVASGSYVGNGSGQYTGIKTSGTNDATFTSPNGSSGTITLYYRELPFSPNAIFIFVKDGESPTVVSQGQSLTMGFTMGSGTITKCPYIGLIGNKLYLIGTTKGSSSTAKSLTAGFNAAGYTYCWFAF